MPTQSGATDINGAAARLSGLLSEQSMPTEKENPEAQDEQAQEHDVKPEAEAQSQETPEGDTKGEVQKYKVKVDGEELEVDYDELILGYQREASYRQKTMKHAEENRKERETIQAKAAEIDKQLEDARLLIEDELSLLESPEMLELKEDDPERYLKKLEKVQNKVKKFEDLKAKREAEHEKRQTKLIEREREALFDAFPEWKGDQNKMNEQSNELFDVMRSRGYSDEELAGITDHRLFVMARDLQRLQAIEKANIEAKAVKTKPKNSKPGTPATKEQRESASVQEMRAKLKRTGKLQDAVNLLRN